MKQNTITIQCTIWLVTMFVVLHYYTTLACPTSNSDVFIDRFISWYFPRCFLYVSIPFKFGFKPSCIDIAGKFCSIKNNTSYLFQKCASIIIRNLIMHSRDRKYGSLFLPIFLSISTAATCCTARLTSISSSARGRMLAVSSLNVSTSSSHHTR